MEEPERRTEQDEEREYQKRILKALERQQAQNARLFRLVRTLTILCAAGMICTLAAAIWLYPQVKETAQTAKRAFNRMETLTAELIEMDLDKIEEDLTVLLEQATDTAVVVSKTGETLSELDMESLNTAIRHLAVAADALDDVDFSKLAKAIQTLHDIVNAFSSIRIFGKPLLQ